jgi:hypothetical protein
MLPPLPLSRRQELVALTLLFTNLSAQFLCKIMMYALFFVCVATTLAAQFLCILMVYTFFFVGVGHSLSYLLNCSNNIKSCWWQVMLVSYVLYMMYEHVILRTPLPELGHFGLPQGHIPFDKKGFGLIR